MKRTLLVVAVATAFAFPSPRSVAQEQEPVDMAKLSCGDLEGEEDIGFYVAWADGYMRGRTQETTVAIDWFEKLTDHVVTACESDAERTIVGIVEVFQQK